MSSPHTEAPGPCPRGETSGGPGRRKANRKLLALAILAYGAAAAIGSWVAVTPRWYAARALVELGPGTLPPGEAPTGPGGAPESGPPRQADRFAAATAALRSTEVLEKVVAKRQLVTRWGLPGPEQAVDRLRSRITVEEEPGTDLIRLEVVATDRQEAAELANDIGSSSFRSGAGRGTVHEIATPPRHSSSPNVRGWSLLAGLLAMIGMGALTAAWVVPRSRSA